MSKNRVIDSIDRSIVDKKNELSKRRVSQVSSSLQQIICEVIHGEFAESCRSFSVINCDMSKDLKYLDVFVKFFTIDDKDLQQKLLKQLNYEQLFGPRRQESPFFKIGLNYHLTQKIAKRMRLRILPEIRFRIADDAMLYVS